MAKIDVKEKFKRSALYLSLILKFIAIFIGIMAIYMLVWKVFGHSPTSDSVMLFSVSLLATLVGANIAITLNLLSDFGKFKYKMGRLESDIYYIKSDIRHIKGSLSNLSEGFNRAKNQT